MDIILLLAMRAANRRLAGESGAAMREALQKLVQAAAEVSRQQQETPKPAAVAVASISGDASFYQQQQWLQVWMPGRSQARGLPEISATVAQLPASCVYAVEAVSELSGRAARRGRDGDGGREGGAACLPSGREQVQQV